MPVGTQTLTGYPKVGGDVDELGFKIDIPQVEAEARHPPVGLGEGKNHRIPCRPALVGGEPVLVLPRSDTDRRDTGTASSCLRGNVGRITSILRSPLANRSIEMSLLSANERTDRRNAVPIFARC